MKIARFFSVIFAVIGTVLLVGSIGFLLWNRNADVRIRELPEEAMQVADDFCRALNDGDLGTAAQLMYGQPDLGVDRIPEDPESALAWDAFCSSIVFELTGQWEVEQSALVRTATITSLDISAVLGKLPELVQSALDQRIMSAENLSDIYDEQNEFREELVEEILQEVLQQALTRDAELVTREVTVKLVNRDGRWWVVPPQNLLQILTGLA